MPSRPLPFPAPAPTSVRVPPLGAIYGTESGLGEGGGLQKTLLFLRTPTHGTVFAATRMCLVTQVTKKRLATSLYCRHENFGCYVGNKLVANHAQMRLKQVIVL